ncbi:hypothetical protein [Dysgonomonas reticulitermitis]
MKITKILSRTSLFMFIISMACVCNANAQVTIGSGIKPNPACLLDLKTNEIKDPVSVTDATNITSTTGGLGLPRVQLVNLTTLEPFIPNNTDWNSDKDKVKERHAGLTVYNINVSGPNEQDKNKVFSQGLYVWDGAQWRLVKDDSSARQYFYMPSCYIDLTSGTVGKTYSYNLYDEYKRQFTKTGNPQFISSNSSLSVISSANGNRVYLLSELDYVISYYDPNIITKVSINSDGVLSYTLKSLSVTPHSFLNVIFVVK